MHTIDAKNRMSLPAPFRQELQRRSDHPPILTNGHECIDLYPYEDWVVHEKEIVAKAAIDPNARDYVRLMISGAVEAPIDKQGRILVPLYLREQAHIERDVTVAGVGLTIEIWDAARLQKNLNQTQANFRAISLEMAEKVGS